MEEIRLENLNFDLKNKIESIPDLPGVYIYKNKNEKIIYVGKAVNLRNRVRSYFQINRIIDAKTKALVKNIADIEYIVTDKEAEALILEDTLIKKYKPKYNILLRDDKTYPYIKVTNEEFPRILSTRRISRDGSKYFGPYTEVKSMKKLLRLVRSVFRIRSCNLNLTEESIAKGKFKLCLYYQIGKCDGPCEGLISKSDYEENVRNTIRLIEGKTNEIERKIEKKMNEVSENLEFERAAYFRNQLFLIRDFTYHQKVLTTEFIDRDVVGLARNSGYVCSLIFKVRDGKLIGKRHYILRDSEKVSDSQMLRLTLEKWYLESEFVPEEILLPSKLEDEIFLMEYLKQKRGKAVNLIVPKVGDKRKIVKLACENAVFQLKEYLLSIQKKDAIIPKTILQMQKDLQLSITPRFIVCFDNSHFQGQEFVSSVVAFKDGKALKSEYRRLKINSVSVGDDFLAMRESVERYFQRAINESKDLPNLVIIDGGKGQLYEAFSVLEKYNLENKVNVISIAKKFEEIFLSNKKDPISLPRSSSTLQLIQRIRDEAHRFAVQYHRKLRKKRTITTELLQIKGVGEITAKKLLTTFGSVNSIKTKSKEELTKVVGEKIAEKILTFFREKNITADFEIK